MILVNGLKQNNLPANDRGLAYGDGLFTTIAVVDGIPVYLKEHYLRLQQGAKRLQIAPIPAREDINNTIEQITQLRGRSDYVIKIILTRGHGGRGYQFPEPQQPHWVVMDSPMPQYPSSYYQQGIDICLSTVKLGRQPQLAGIKHLNRLEQVLARNSLPGGFQEAVLCDSENRIIEGIQSNLFFIQQNILCTPNLSHCGVTGIIREKILCYCDKQGIDYHTGDYPVEVLESAQSLFFCNSIIGIWPVRSFIIAENHRVTYDFDPLLLQLAEYINTVLKHPAIIKKQARGCFVTKNL